MMLLMHSHFSGTKKHASVNVYLPRPDLEESFPPTESSHQVDTTPKVIYTNEVPIDEPKPVSLSIVDRPNTAKW